MSSLSHRARFKCGQGVCKHAALCETVLLALNYIFAVCERLGLGVTTRGIIYYLGIQAPNLLKILRLKSKFRVYLVRSPPF